MLNELGQGRVSAVSCWLVVTVADLSTGFASIAHLDGVNGTVTSVAVDCVGMSVDSDSSCRGVAASPLSLAAPLAR